jgi:hypothetical protein
MRALIANYYVIFDTEIEKLARLAEKIAIFADFL